MAEHWLRVWRDRAAPAGRVVAVLLACLLAAAPLGAAPEPSITERWAPTLVGLSWTRLSPEIQRKTKLTLLDGLGVMIYVSGREQSRRLLDFAASARVASGGASVIGLPGRYEPGMAAFANGALLHGYEVDDTDLRSYLHPSGVIVPAALAAAEAEHASGRALLEAMVAGYQVAGQLALALNPLPSQPLQLGGFMPSSVAGTVGAAAVAARLLDLPERGVVDALGIAGSQSFGLMTYGYDGSDEKALHAGRAAQTGMFAARLAAAGFRGPEHVLESPRGLFAGHDIPLDEAALLDGFADMTAVLYITPKRFSCSHSVAPYVEAVAAWEESHGRLDPATIEKVLVRVDIDPSRLRRLPELLEPATLIAAQLNPIIPIAVYLVEGDVFVEQWEGEAWRDPEVLAMARRFEVAPSPGGETALVLHTRDGARHEVPVEFRYGDRFPPDREDFYRAKFRRLTRHALDDAEAQEIVTRVLSLELETDVAQLLERLRTLLASRSAAAR